MSTHGSDALSIRSNSSDPLQSFSETCVQSVCRQDSTRPTGHGHVRTSSDPGCTISIDLKLVRFSSPHWATSSRFHGHRILIGPFSPSGHGSSTGPSQSRKVTPPRYHSPSSLPGRATPPLPPPMPRRPGHDAPPLFSPRSRAAVRRGRPSLWPAHG